MAGNDYRFEDVEGKTEDYCQWPFSQCLALVGFELKNTNKIKRMQENPSFCLGHSFKHAISDDVTTFDQTRK